MLRIGDIEGKPGERVFGYITVDETRGRIPVQIPINILCGLRDGPTLLVDAAIHGEENIGTVAIGQLLRNLDPKDIRGTLIAVPAVNTSGFEFGQREVKWDGKDLNRQGEGDPNGTTAQRLAYFYFHEVISKAEAFVDIHSGGPDAYVWYTIYLETEGTPEVVAKSKEMALAFGLQQIFSRTPWKGTLKEVATRKGIPSITPEIGGGADFMYNGQQQIDICERCIRNVMIYLDMLDGRILTEAPTAKIYHGKHEITSGPHHGIFMRKRRWGEFIRAGEVYGTMYHPYTGEKLADIVAPADGVILNSGRVWPVVARNRFATILGDLVEEVELSQSAIGKYL